MASVFFEKVVNTLPAVLSPNTMYMVRKGSGFDFYVSDETGSVAYPLNASGGGSPYISPPVILTPTNGQTDVFPISTITAGAFELVNATADTHVASQWQIRLASGDWNSPVYDSGETTNLTSLPAPRGVLQNYTQYVVRVRYKGASLGWSDWSQEVTFTTSEYTVDATGGTVTIDGDYKVHTFTSSGTFTLSIAGPDQVAVEYLIVAGGGGGGMTYGGGGGAGGLLTGSGLMLSPGSYAVVVGAGGSGAAVTSSKGANGSNSSFNSITAIGGGGGGSNSNLSGANGGSGGGASTNSSGGSSGLGTAGQGYNGGTSTGSAPPYGGGGGGGAGGGGINAIAGHAGNGGPGIASSITGASVFYAAGGGAGSRNDGVAGLGGNGIGGNGSNTSITASSAVANTGSGGGGSGYSGSYAGSGGNGSSGIVIIRYRYQ